MLSRFVPLVLFLLFLPVTAEALTEKEQLLQSLYSKSGLQIQIQQLPDSIRQYVEQDMASRQLPQDVKPEHHAILMESYVKAFVPSVIKKTVLEAFDRQLSSEDIRAVLQWLDSPLGSRIVSIEEEANSPSALKGFPKFVETLRKRPPPPDRLRILNRLDIATKSTEFVLEFTRVAALAMAVGLRSIFPTDKPATIPELMATVEKAVAATENQIRTQMTLFMNFVYRPVSNAEIETYLEFINSAAGQKYYKAGRGGMAKAFNDSVLMLPDILVKGFDAKKI